MKYISDCTPLQNSDFQRLVNFASSTGGRDARLPTQMEDCECNNQTQCCQIFLKNFIYIQILSIKFSPQK